MSSGWLIDTYMHWHFKFNRLFLVYFIENEIWARGGCTTTAGAETDEREKVKNGVRSKEEMEEKYKIRVRKNIKLPSCGSTGGAPPPLQLHRPRFIRQGLCGKGLRWESQTTVTDISDNHKHNDPHTRIQ